MTAPDFGALLVDLAGEAALLDAVVADLDAEKWDTPTPAAGWTVRDQIVHLAMGDELAALAVVDPDTFASTLAALLGDLDAVLTKHAAAAAAPASEVLASWRAQREALLAALGGLDGSERILWITGDMGARSFATSRLMETWAHGQDVLDALGVNRLPAARLRHIADLGVRTRAFSFVNRGEPAPAGDVRVELIGPDGTPWEWGGEDAPGRVRGAVVDFCLVVTQRRHVDDTGLVVEGEAARRWMEIAQAFAGPPTTAQRSMS